MNIKDRLQIVDIPKPIRFNTEEEARAYGEYCDRFKHLGFPDIVPPNGFVEGDVGWDTANYEFSYLVVNNLTQLVNCVDKDLRD